MRHAAIDIHTHVEFAGTFAILKKRCVVKMCFALLTKYISVKMLICFIRMRTLNAMAKQ